jgi:hypothetical protein
MNAKLILMFRFSALKLPPTADAERNGNQTTRALSSQRGKVAVAASTGKSRRHLWLVRCGSRYVAGLAATGT